MRFLKRDKYLNFKDKIIILTLERSYREFVTKNDKVITSVHPPEVNFTLKLGDDEVSCTPYRKSDNVEAVVAQNNFTNWTLKTMGDQLNRIEKNVSRVST